LILVRLSLSGSSSSWAISSQDRRGERRDRWAHAFARVWRAPRCCAVGSWGGRHPSL